MSPLPQKLPRRLLTLLLALALLAPASSFGAVLYSCGMSGKVSREGCCCHQAKLKEAHDARAAGLERRAEASRPACCSAEDNRRAAATGSLAEVEAPLSTAAAVTLLPILPEPALLAQHVSFRARSIRGPPFGRRAFARNCSFLI